MANKAAQELGKKGGSVKSEAKAKAAKANAQKPRGKWVTAIAYAGIDGYGKSHKGLLIERGRIIGGTDEEFKAVCSDAKTFEWTELETTLKAARVL